MGKEHFNFIGKDPKIGPILLSILKNQNNQIFFLVFTQYGVHMLQSSFNQLPYLKSKKINAKFACELMKSSAQNNSFSDVILYPVHSPDIHFDLSSLESFLVSI